MSMSTRVVIKLLWWDLTDSHPAVNHQWILAVDFAAFCDNQNTIRAQLRPFGSVKFLKSEEPATLWLPTTPHPLPL